MDADNSDDCCCVLALGCNKVNLTSTLRMGKIILSISSEMKWENVKKWNTLWGFYQQL